MPTTLVCIDWIPSPDIRLTPPARFMRIDNRDLELHMDDFEEWASNLWGWPVDSWQVVGTAFAGVR